MENLKYYIFDLSEVDKINFDQVIELNKNNLRLSTNGTKSFFKFFGDSPEFLSTMTSLQGPLTHSEIKTILRGSDWS